MRKTVGSLLLLVSLLVQGKTNEVSQKSSAEVEHAKWIASVIDAASSIQPGMTRKDLFRLFKEEGGLSTRRRRQYVYRECPYIKVDVEFAAVGDLNSSTEAQEDKITKISSPYLQYAIAD